MKENVRKELNDLLMMVVNWRQSYLDLAEINSDNSTLLEEIREDIHEHIVPFIVRLMEVEYITATDARDFFKSVNKELEGLQEDLDNLEETITPEEIGLLLGQFRVHHDLIYLHREKFKGDYFDFIEEQKLKLAEIAMKIVPYLRRNLCTCDTKCSGGCS